MSIHSNFRSDDSNKRIKVDKAAGEGMKRLERIFDIAGKVAVVTGGTNGLGRDMARLLAEAGCLVAVTSRDKDKARIEADRLSEETGGCVIGVQMDQCEYSSCEAMAKHVSKEFGRIDILINNAGGGSGIGECNFLERDPMNIAMMIAVNLTGSIYCCRAICPLMAVQASGRIINIGSIAGLVGRDREMYRSVNKMEQPVEYAAAKGGVLAYTRDLAAFMAPYGVTVNSLSPGGFDKGELSNAFVEAYAARTPLGRMGRMDSDLLGAVLFLASDASAYITGQNIVVDGGFSVCK